MRRAALFLFIVIFVLFMAGCGSQSQSQDPPPVTLPYEAYQFVSLTIGDTPPAGVTVLFFQLSITGASMSSPTAGNISLLSNPIPVNVTQLQTDSAFLGTGSVLATAPDKNESTETYTSLSVTFSNPQLTIFNGSGAAIGSCASNTVCQLTPSTAPLTLTFSSAPFPITLPMNPLAFKLDIHLNTVIQPDLTVNLAAPNGVTLSQLPTPSSGTTISGLGKLTGTIQSVPPAGTAPASDNFTLQTGDGRTFNISLDSNTTYSYPSTVCSADNVSCLAVGQIVNVDLSLQDATSGAILIGGLLASNISYVQPAGQTVVEGNIISVTFPATYPSGNAVMQLMPQQGPPTPTANALPFGQMVTVTVPLTGVAYAIDSGSFTLPNGPSFTQAADLMVGQQVSVVVVPGSVTTTSGSTSMTSIVGPAATTLTAGSITLEPSQITGVVSAWATVNTSALTFTINTYPNYFVPPATTAGAPPSLSSINIDVQATSATTYSNLTPDNISGLAVGDVVSVKGWLFPYGAVPQICKAGAGCAPFGVIAAEAVVGRPGATPLF